MSRFSFAFFRADFRRPGSPYYQEKEILISEKYKETTELNNIKAAIESGELSAERYILYKSLSAENVKNYAKKKEISKWAKAAKKMKREYDL